MGRILNSLQWLVNEREYWKIYFSFYLFYSPYQGSIEDFENPTSNRKSVPFADRSIVNDVWDVWIERGV